MTREEAIKMLKSKMDGHTDTSYEWAETVRMAVKALEQEPCEDAISRAEVLDLCDSKDHEYKVTHFKEDVECLPPVYPKQNLDKIRAEIESLSNANPSYWHSGDMVDREDVLDIIDKYRAEGMGG